MSEEKNLMDKEEDYLNDVKAYIQDEAVNEEEGDEFDFLKDIPHVDPTVEQTRTMVQEEITKAMESLSETDQDIFESTGLIHINREIDGETLVDHAIRMQKIGNRKQDRKMAAVTVLVLIGIALCVTGMLFQKQQKERINNHAAVVTTPDPDKVADTEAEVEINESSFPDKAFRKWAEETADTDGNGKLSPNERNNTLIILCSGNDQIENVKGIENFPQLQGLDLSNTSVTELDLSQNTMLEYVNASGTKITALDLRENTALSEVNVKGCTELTELYMPEPSVLKTLNTEGTSFWCETDNDGSYTACRYGG